MTVVFKPDETFRDDFSFATRPGRSAASRFRSPRTVPVLGDLEAHKLGRPGGVVEFPIDIDEHYVAEVASAPVLRRSPRFQALPHMPSAQWTCSS